MLAFGFLVGMATSIKPTALPIGIVLLWFAAYVLYRRHQRYAAHVGWALAGFFIAAALNLVFLLHYHAVGPFWFVTHEITPHYIALAHPGFADMLRNLLPRGVRNFVLLAGISLFALNRGTRDWDWERWALATTAACGLASYFLQHKGFVQHRYIFEAFLLLLIGLEITSAIKRGGWPQVCAAAVMLASVLWFVPQCIRQVGSYKPETALTVSMEHDLTALGPDRLQHQVFCFDLVYGCINSLYHLQIVENAGFTGDLLLFFPQEGGPATRYYRDLFWKTQAEHPASVLVMTNQWLQRPDSFDKINTWPDFVTWLAANYTLVKTRSFPTADDLAHPGMREPRGYRLYIRNGSPLLPDAERTLAAQRE